MSIRTNTKLQDRKALVIGAALVLALGGGFGAFAQVAHAEQVATPQAIDATKAQPEKTWPVLASAEEAAANAGLARFIAPQFEVAGMTFSNPTFSAEGHVAQATYSVDGSTLTLRQAGDNPTESTSPVRTHDLGIKWTQDIDGIGLIVCGNEEGAAITAQWDNGGAGYGITLEGGKTMSADDVANVVRTVRDANANPAPAQVAQPEEQEQKSEEQKSEEQKVEQKVEQKSKATEDADYFYDRIIEDGVMYQTKINATTGNVVEKVYLGGVDVDGNLIDQSNLDLDTYLDTMVEDGALYQVTIATKTGDVLMKTFVCELDALDYDFMGATE